MKTKLLASILLAVTYVTNASSQTAQTLSPGAALLFKNVKTTLTVPEKNQAFQATGLSLAPDKQSFTKPVENGDVNFGAEAIAVDLNKDGKQEVIVSYGTTVTMYTSLVLVRNTAGHFEIKLNAAGAESVEALNTLHAGFADIETTGQDFENGGLTTEVYHWNGKQYVKSE